MRKFIPLGIMLILGAVTFGIAQLTHPLNSACPKGYVLVPGSAAFSTNDFCAMQTEAQRSASPTCDGNSCPVADTGAKPWNFASVLDGQNACTSLGSNYDLMSDAQWMTIADNLARTPINDLDTRSGPQYTNGNSSAQRGMLVAPMMSLSLQNCDINSPLADDKNNACPLRTIGLTGTTQKWEETYIPGGTNRSQMRTTVLSNGNVLWDFIGNIWEWTKHPFVDEPKTGTGERFENDSNGMDGNGMRATYPIDITQWVEYKDIAEYGIMAGSKPQNIDGLTQVNGIGRISLNPGWSWDDASNYTTPLKAIARGGAWANNANSGMYSLDLALGPSYQRHYTGFRCVVPPNE